MSNFESLALVRLTGKYGYHRGSSEWIRTMTHNDVLRVFYIDPEFFYENVVNVTHREIRKRRIILSNHFDEEVLGFTLRKEASELVIIAPKTATGTKTYGVIGMLYVGRTHDSYSTEVLDVGTIEMVPSAGYTEELSERLDSYASKI